MKEYDRKKQFTNNMIQRYNNILAPKINMTSQNNNRFKDYTKKDNSASIYSVGSAYSGPSETFNRSYTSANSLPRPTVTDNEVSDGITIKKNGIPYGPDGKPVAHVNQYGAQGNITATLKTIATQARTKKLTT